MYYPKALIGKHGMQRGNNINKNKVKLVNERFLIFFFS